MTKMDNSSLVRIFQIFYYDDKKIDNKIKIIIISITSEYSYTYTYTYMHSLYIYIYSECIFL